MLHNIAHAFLVCLRARGWCADLLTLQLELDALQNELTTTDSRLLWHFVVLVAMPSHPFVCPLSAALVMHFGVLRIRVARERVVCRLLAVQVLRGRDNRSTWERSRPGSSADTAPSSSLQLGTLQRRLGMLLMPNSTTPLHLTASQPRRTSSIKSRNPCYNYNKTKPTQHVARSQ